MNVATLEFYRNFTRMNHSVAASVVFIISIIICTTYIFIAFGILLDE
jgi:hypothetical protein